MTLLTVGGIRLGCLDFKLCRGVVFVRDVSEDFVGRVQAVDEPLVFEGAEDLEPSEAVPDDSDLVSDTDD